MDAPSLPRFFVPRPAGSVRAPRSVRLSNAHALDAFTIISRHVDSREWVVMVDVHGEMQLVPRDARDVLPLTVQTELTAHDVARGRPVRALDVTELFLFDLQLLEQSPDALGPFDPVRLHGVLHGPFPVSSHPTSTVAEGHLTVTRADLLDGLVTGTADAFRYESSEHLNTGGVFALHAMLPGGGDELLRDGQNVILAWPLMPAEISPGDASNEVMVAQLLHEILSALQRGMRRDNIRHSLKDVLLPVPSRSALEADLEADGYTIKEGIATRRGSNSSGFGGFLASVFGGLGAEKLTLPPEGTCADFIALARTVLTSLQGWPTPRIHALHTRIVQGGQTSRGSTLSIAPEHRGGPMRTTPVRTTPVRTTPTPTMPQAPVRKPSGSDRPDWMTDFDSGAAQPPTTKPSPAAAPASSDDPDWMKDFK